MKVEITTWTRATFAFFTIYHLNFCNICNQIHIFWRHNFFPVICSSFSNYFYSLTLQNTSREIFLISARNQKSPNLTRGERGGGCSDQWDWQLGVHRPPRFPSRVGSVNFLWLLEGPAKGSDWGGQSLPWRGVWAGEGVNQVLDYCLLLVSLSHQRRCYYCVYCFVGSLRFIWLEAPASSIRLQPFWQPWAP